MSDRSLHGPDTRAEYLRAGETTRSVVKVAMTTTTSASLDRELDFARQLTLVERSVVLRLAEALKAEGATIEEWRVLSLLGDGSGHAMNEIAEFAMLPAPTLTKIVD